MTELAEIRDEMLEFVAKAEGLERENEQLRSSINVARRKFREQAIRHGQTVADATRKSCLRELSNLSALKVDHEVCQHELASLKAFIQSSPQKLALLDYDEGHVAVYNNSNEALSLANHVLVFSCSHQYEFQRDVMLPARSSLSVWFGRALKALANPLTHSLHWDFDLPQVPDKLSLTLNGLELASITKTHANNEPVQMREGLPPRKRGGHNEAEQANAQSKRRRIDTSSENRVNIAQSTHLEQKQRREEYDPRLLAAWRSSGPLCISEASWSTSCQGKEKKETLRLHVKNTGTLPVHINDKWSLRFGGSLNSMREQIAVPTALLKGVGEGGSPPKGECDEAVLRVEVPIGALGAGSVSLVDAAGLARATARVSQGPHAASAPTEGFGSPENAGCVIV